jgi:hypothetical protein
MNGRKDPARRLPQPPTAKRPLRQPLIRRNPFHVFRGLAMLATLPIEQLEPEVEPRDELETTVFVARRIMADARLTGQLESALCSLGHVCLRTINIQVADGLATLRGQVPSYYVKQLAQATAQSIPGIRSVRNELDVTTRSRL